MVRRRVVAQFSRRPLDADRCQSPRGQVYVVIERCKGCSFCWEYCPEDVLEQSEALNSRGYRYPRVLVDMHDACVDCGMCTEICPEFAIFTRQLTPEEVDRARVVG